MHNHKLAAQLAQMECRVPRDTTQLRCPVTAGGKAVGVPLMAVQQVVEQRIAAVEAVVLIQAPAEQAGQGTA